MGVRMTGETEQITNSTASFRSTSAGGKAICTLVLSWEQKDPAPKGLGDITLDQINQVLHPLELWPGEKRITAIKRLPPTDKLQRHNVVGTGGLGNDSGARTETTRRRHQLRVLPPPKGDFDQGKRRQRKKAAR